MEGVGRDAGVAASKFRKAAHVVKIFTTRSFYFTDVSVAVHRHRR